tara:strand:- start:509 stop:691 length:183 start_codon:yes stop_codon:yes gene_type:complete
MADIKMSVQYINEQINRFNQSELEELAELLANSFTGTKLINLITYGQYESINNKGGKFNG